MTKWISFNDMHSHEYSHGTLLIIISVWMGRSLPGLVTVFGSFKFILSLRNAVKILKPSSLNHKPTLTNYKEKGYHDTKSLSRQVFLYNDITSLGQLTGLEAPGARGRASWASSLIGRCLSRALRRLPLPASWDSWHDYRMCT